MLELAGGAGIIPSLPNEPQPESEPKPEPENPSLPHPDQDRALAQTVAHYRAVLPPDGTVDGDAGSFDYAEHFRAFEAESRRIGVLFDGLQPDFTGGREHDLIYDLATGTVLKFTKPSRAGYEVNFDFGEPSLIPGLPVGYLERLELHNEIFADDISFVGMGGNANNRRIITRQGLIEGRKASLEEIIRLMVEELGFAKLRNNFGIGFEDSYAFIKDGLAVFDMRPANVFMTRSGVMAVIDSIPVRLTRGQRSILGG